MWEGWTLRAHFSFLRAARAVVSVRGRLIRKSLSTPNARIAPLLGAGVWEGVGGSGLGFLLGVAEFLTTLCPPGTPRSPTPSF